MGMVSIYNIDNDYMIVASEHLWIIIILTMIGKGFGSGAYAIITLYTPEIYPTTMRSTAVAVANLFSRFGSLSAPYIVDIVSTVYSND